MSSLIVDTLTNQNSQLCKAWVNFNGTGTVAIRDGYNVSSITDTGAGKYTITFMDSIPSNYAVSITAQALGAGLVGSIGGSATVEMVSTSNQTPIYLVSGSGTALDSSVVNLSVFGS